MRAFAIGGAVDLEGGEGSVEDGECGGEERVDEAAAEEEDEEDAVHSDGVVDAERLVWEEVANDVAAVERRDGNEVEEQQDEIDEDAVIEHQRHGKEQAGHGCRIELGGQGR